ncbi:MAG TPA: PEP-CTERM sorting domain-containing protein [Casimicrobiaceae bacterium]|nr:PEP-CTERM sorting domain-containing protein [Casimicrobiaceae bacterium]
MAVVTLAFGGVASARFYDSSFDPLGPLTFSGTGRFYADDACFAADGVYAAAACNLTLLSATVDMTNGVDSAHLDFVSILPNTLDMIDLIISGGELVGVNTNAIGWVFPGTCTGTLCGDPWWVQWGASVDIDPVYLYTGSCDGPCFRNDNPESTAFDVTFKRVPEPGTLALLLGALGIGGLMRRRPAA